MIKKVEGNRLLMDEYEFGMAKIYWCAYGIIGTSIFFFILALILGLVYRGG